MLSVVFFHSKPHNYSDTALYAVIAVKNRRNIVQGSHLLPKAPERAAMFSVWANKYKHLNQCGFEGFIAFNIMAAGPEWPVFFFCLTRAYPIW